MYVLGKEESQDKASPNKKPQQLSLHIVKTVCKSLKHETLYWIQLLKFSQPAEWRLWSGKQSPQMNTEQRDT